MLAAGTAVGEDGDIGYRGGDGGGCGGGSDAVQHGADVKVLADTG